MHIRYETFTPLLLLITLANVLYIKKQLQNIAQRHQQLNPVYSYLGHDYPENLPLPVFPLPVISVLDEESTHYPLLGNVSDDEWFSLTSDGFGYTRLGKDHRLFMVTVFHEIHCLRILNLAFSKAHIASPGHIQHCLNYIRQGVLCSADLSLEPGDFETRDFGVDRFGAVHTCKSWNMVYEEMSRTFSDWLAVGEEWASMQ